jgi:hypothetical protein
MEIFVEGIKEHGEIGGPCDLWTNWIGSKAFQY